LACRYPKTADHDHRESPLGRTTDRVGTTRQIGSLVLGVYESGTLVPAGSVGTGFNAEQATALKTKLAKLEQKEPPFANGAPKPGRWSKRRLGEERWVKPTLVAEVEFAEWTPEGHVRHGSFISLRADKAATEVVREIQNNVMKPAALRCGYAGTLRYWPHKSVSEARMNQNSHAWSSIVRAPIFVWIRRGGRSH
jgi:hypothetical protein